MRIFTLVSWWPWILLIIFRFNSQPFPVAICQYVDCSVITYYPINWIIVLLMLVASYFYIRERHTIAVTVFFILISVLSFSLERSNGLTYRSEMMSMVWIGQLVAYAVYQYKRSKGLLTTDHHPGPLVIHYSKQMLAAAFVVSAIYKLSVAGIFWVVDSPNVALQVVKTNMDVMYTFGADWVEGHGKGLASIILAYPNLFRFLFFCGISLELLSFVAVFNKRAALGVGLFFIPFFISTFTLMWIIIPSFLFYVMVYFVRVPYLVSLIFKKDESPVIGPANTSAPYKQPIG